MLAPMPTAIFSTKISHDNELRAHMSKANQPTNHTRTAPLRMSKSSLITKILFTSKRTTMGDDIVQSLVKVSPDSRRRFGNERYKMMDCCRKSSPTCPTGRTCIMRRPTSECLSVVLKKKRADPHLHQTRDRRNSYKAI